MFAGTFWEINWEANKGGEALNHNHPLYEFWMTYPKGSVAPGTRLAVWAYCEAAGGADTQIWKRGVLYVDKVGYPCIAEGVF